ncbi:CobW family GTP-binding protein [Zhihengliuella salsuginis]|uniref:Cobalamin biosynthesis protein n=1 Tax=Zhihengliuella salsuginis TaxID=578222 RepID=A0ABQ3GLN3_9MICC|nr:GTP-binding protein [Zhihengliuella salsuginis]GHD11072.1 cobalamin biosynthesis protein [Zhihengliuella salsuginis]
MAVPAPVPVIVLAGYLGAGKTTLLNRVLREPGARVGVIVNDFGDINIDVGLVTGQVDQAASIAGGCLCCIEDVSELDDALEQLSAPRLALDAIVVEASGLADPVALAQLIRDRESERTRLAAVVDVVDAADHFGTVDDGDLPPLRYQVASLVVVNKLDRLPEAEREPMVERIRARVRERNARAEVVGAVGGRIDAALLFDVARPEEDPDQLPLRELLIEAAASGNPLHGTGHDHVHAHSATATSEGPVDAARVLAALERPVPGAYRLKGHFAVRTAAGRRGFTANAVGGYLHLAERKPPRQNALVAIGVDLDEGAARSALEAALDPAESEPHGPSLMRLERHVRLSGG